jgi:GNAT superfamily N-acetyltransferase
MDDSPAADPIQRPTLLTAVHRVDSFDCEVSSLNSFLRHYALQDQKGGKARTYVATRDDTVVTYYSLAPGSVAPAEVPGRVAKGQGQQHIPVILLARLAVDHTEQGKGLGSHMLLDALRRAVEGAEVIGGRAVLVHAVDERAGAFYRAYDFEPSPIDDLHLLLLMKDIRRTLGL